MEEIWCNKHDGKIPQQDCVYHSRVKWQVKIEHLFKGCADCPHFRVILEKSEGSGENSDDFDEIEEDEGAKHQRKQIHLTDLKVWFSTFKTLFPSEYVGGNVSKTVEKDITLVLNHSSFFKDRRFLRWQLMRLNEAYQEHYKLTMKNFWMYLLSRAYCREPFHCARLMEGENYLKRLLRLTPFKECLYEKYLMKCDHGKGKCCAHLFLMSLCVGLHVDFRPNDDSTMTLEDWDKLRSGLFNESVLPFAGFLGIEYPPMSIDPSIRFPLSLEYLPEFIAYEKRGASNWARILLELELYQTGMRQVDIARRLEGLEIGKPSNEGLKKASAYERVQKNIRYGREAVSKAYPFPTPNMG